jgi:hypothetical protein
MKTINLIAGAVLGLASTLATAAEWEDVKSPTELRALYSNKTFKGKDYLDRPWVGHYRADGKGIMISEAGRIPRTWAVMGNDQVCVNTPFNTLCFRFQRHASTPGTYRSINVANDMTTVFVVEDGVPEF